MRSILYQQHNYSFPQPINAYKNTWLWLNKPQICRTGGNDSKIKISWGLWLLLAFLIVLLSFKFTSDIEVVSGWFIQCNDKILLMKVQLQDLNLFKKRVILPVPP